MYYVAPGNGTLAVVVVTYNRADMLTKCLESLNAQSHKATRVYVVDNASTDHTQQVLSNLTWPISTIKMQSNTGGAGGFSAGLEKAYNDGFDWILLIDDDVLLDRDCLFQFLKYRKDAMIGVREDKNGKLVERAALEYNLKNPLRLKPRKKSIEDIYPCRSDMPKLLPVESAAFEGFMVHRNVISKVGFPRPEYFIFYDDLDYTIRIRKAGFHVNAVRDAVIIRQQNYSTNSALTGWKGFYMYRNFFLIHYRFGENIFVKIKPLVLLGGALVVKCLSIFQYPKKTRTLWRAFFSSISVAIFKSNRYFSSAAK